MTMNASNTSTRQGIAACLGMNEVFTGPVDFLLILG
jgi:hypothetical protein